MFDPTTLLWRAGDLLLVTDGLGAPAEFIMLALLTSHLKQATRRKCVLVSFSQVFSHWNSVASRLSPPTSLSTYTTKGSFTFIDALSEEPVPSNNSLRPLYDKIAQALEGGEAVEVNDDNQQPNLVILDSISLLEWTGTPILEVKRFVRAVRALCRKRNAMSVIRHHRVTSDNLDDLHRAILAQCTLHLEVLPLASGRSSAISGEIALHAGPLLEDPKRIHTIHRSAAVQYRLRDTGATYFDRGTSSVVL